MNKPLRIAVGIALSQLFIPTQSVLAGGTSFTETSVSGLGNSFAGSAASAEDASVMYWNPAALTRFKRAELVGGVMVAQIDANYINSKTPPAEYQGGPTSGEPGKSYRKDTPARVAVPFNYAAIPLNDKTVLGLSVNGSSGLVVRYPQDYPGRAQGTDTDIKVVRFNVGLARKITNTLSVGINGGYERFFSHLRAKINYNAAVASTNPTNNSPFGGIINTGLQGATVPPGQEEASVSIRTWGYAFNAQIGGLWEPTERTRLGFGYRPKTTFDNEGPITISQIPPGVTSAANATNASNADVLTLDQRAYMKITLPSELNMSVYHDVNSDLAVMGSFIRNDFTSSKVDYRTQNGVIIQSPEQNFTVTKRYGLGANYKVAKRLMLRGGIAKENSAVSDRYRLTALPDNDRRIYNIGASFIIDKNATLDIGYERINFKDAPVGNNPQSTDVAYSGLVKVKADIIGIQLNDRF